MSCALTSGYALGCRNNVGGISEIRLASYVASGVIATNATGTVTGFTGYASGGTAFYKYELPKGHRFPMVKYELIPEQLIFL